MYELYAVLVHEGEAAGGHYWAYIRPNLSDIWLKFNDISVIEVTWDEVERESMGEHHTASAYCLIYVDHSKQDWIGEWWLYHCVDCIGLCDLCIILYCSL